MLMSCALVREPSKDVGCSAPSDGPFLGEEEASPPDFWLTGGARVQPHSLLLSHCSPCMLQCPVISSNTVASAGRCKD